MAAENGMDNSSAESFRHTPLLPSEIRLLKISHKETNTGHVALSIQAFEISQRPQYTCLSYMWSTGYHEPGLRIIYVNKTAFGVRYNLFDFLQMAQQTRNYTNKWLWIDALCIDQSKMAERNDQVSRMGEIYQEAEEVLAWIRPRDLAPLSRPGTSGLRWIKAFLSRALPKTELEIQFVDTVENDKYWSRAWVVQEQRLARKVTVICGVHTMSGERVIAVYKTLMAARHPKQRFPLSSMEMLLPVPKRNVDALIPRPLIELIRNFHYMQCSDLRDRVYSLRALAEERADIRVDYNCSRTSLFRNIMRLYRHQMCLCVPVLLSGALHMISSRKDDTSMEFASMRNRPYLDVVVPCDYTIRDRRRTKSILTCLCCPYHLRTTGQIVLCTKSLCVPGHHAFHIDRSNKVIMESHFRNGSSYSDQWAFESDDGPILYTEYKVGQRKQARLHLSFSLDALIGLGNSGTGWDQYLKCNRPKSSPQFVLYD